MADKSILITGGTGFLGSALVRKWAGHHPLVVMSRDAAKVASQFGPGVTAVARVADLPDAGHFKAVINLAGAGIFDQRWSESRKRVLRESRVQLTTALTDWILASEKAPEVLISGSAIGIYGDQGDQWLAEDSVGVTDFSQQLCQDWEAAARRAETVTRVCLIRTGLVLGAGGGLLKRMTLPFSLGLGGTLGSGQQWMSWVHIHDWVAIVEAMMADDRMQGAYNATAPNPVTNREFSATFSRLLRRPMLLPLPASLLKLLLGEMAELVLGSQRVAPQRLQQHGFVFHYTELEAALHQVIGK